MALNIKYRSLKAFLYAVETGSFTLGANRLGVTQPSFTALIQDLEQVLDLKLFERSTRAIALTAAGVELRDRIQRPIADLEEAYRSMEDLAAVRRGQVVVGALPSASLVLVPPTLAALRGSHPGLEPKIVEAYNDELLDMLRTNQVEFAIAAQLGDMADMMFEPLVDDTFCVVFPPGHPIGEHDSVSWNDLLSYQLVLLSPGSSARRQFDQALGLTHAPKLLHYDITHMTTAVVLVKQGLGIAVLPKLPLSVLPMGKLRYKPLSDTSAQRRIGIVYRQNRHLSPASRAFISQAKQMAAATEK
ncbi:LysR family transcriptional regulator [Paracandidimonas soli]|uniref:DNA-binding transcriptional LysR family regulator n=1 Tax=Paracandidimonas soli TaxID=1917182 RepID=A0A4R3VD01_9BURK|nr:LysR family transcriptional regulator [Paracandidimonas soli]TCV01459.1 DNA-binding transcriptional LysR family regulator [Paracandidimonas soli]